MAEEKKRILVGLWDCPYCGAKGVNGLKKRCPSCGHPQDEGTKFYLGEEKEYLDEDKAKEYGQGADWTCAYCGALNRCTDEVCSGCGAPREESTGDYFENEKKQEEKAARREADINAAAGVQPEQPKKKHKPWLLIAIALVLLGVLIFNLIPRDKNAVIAGKAWERYLYTETYETVQREDWELPADATLISESTEIHHYNQVLDHYEEVPVQRSRSVIDHYESVTRYQNNGDGTFTEYTENRPVYGTEYYTVYETQPVYIPVPVYATKYVYTHKEWVTGETLITRGSDEEPYWADFTENDTARVTFRSEAYRVSLNADGSVYESRVTADMFASLKTGDSVKATVTGSRLTAIDDKALK